MATNKIHGETSTGFKYTVDPEVIHDMEFIELASDVEENGTVLPKLLEMLLGAKQKAALYDHVRTKKGRVLVEDVSDQIKEIFDALAESAETKN